MNATLMQHQKDAVNFFINNGGIAAFHHDPGCGKTLAALSCYAELRKQDPNLKLLVICPISLIYGAWIKEIEKFTNFQWYNFHSNTCRNDDKGAINGIFILNFEYLINKSKFQSCKDALNKGSWMCVIDESSKMKNYKSVTVDRLNGSWEDGKFTSGIKNFCKYRLELSGTPAPNIEWEYWPQMFFLYDTILGDNFYKFRNKYFQLQRGREIIPGAIFNKAALREMFDKGYKYEFNEAMREEFFGRLKPWCHMVKAKDCLDLPDQVDEYRTFEMKDEQARIYKEMKTQYIAEIKQESNKLQGNIPKDHEEYTSSINVIVANIVLTKMMKLRQITSGFAIDDTNTPRALSTKIPEKIKLLLDIIEEIGNAQLIIWCQFKYEMTMIKNYLSEIADYSQLHGGIPDHERPAELDNFLSRKNRFLIAHPKSAAHGLTLVNCRYEVFFSMDASYESYEQARKRTHRHGQVNSCVYFHLIAQNSVDEDILRICQHKADKQSIAEGFLKCQ